MDDFTDPIANMVRGARYLQEHLPEWFDKSHSVWVDFSNRAKENNMSKKINAGDTLTVGDLTDNYLGAVIEVGPVDGFTTRLNLDKIVDSSAISTIRVLCSKERASRGFYGITPVTVITPPPSPRQPDEPTAFGQCIRIEGDDDWRGMVVDPQEGIGLLWDTDGYWRHWDYVLRRAGDRRIIVSDPPVWPGEDPEVPERIEEGEWPADDTHLREWVWVDRDGERWKWYLTTDKRAGAWRYCSAGLTYPDPTCGPWLRGERVK